MQILLQGGHNPYIPFEWYLELMRYIKRNHPIHIHGFSPSEVVFFSERFNLPVPEVVRELKAAGLRAPNNAKTIFDYEGTRLNEGLTRVTNVPTAAERNGDFSQSLFARPINPFTQQPFDNGQIPPFLINPIGRAIAALYPLPNRSTPFANFVSSPTGTDDVDQFDVRMDHGLGRGSRRSG